MAGQKQSEIRRLLAESDLAPRHRYGQNFLVDLNLMRKLVAAGEVEPADTVLEVGAGTGSLTELLLETGARVVAVEIDHGLQAILKQRLGEHPRCTLVRGDALSGKHRLNPLILGVLRKQASPSGGHIKLVANLPYQIATPLLMDLLLVTPSLERMTCTIQKEVGERLGAAPRTEGYGPVSVVTQTLADITPLAIIPPSAFWPRPRVESLMLTIQPRPTGQVKLDDISGFVAFVQRCFQQRRKMLRRVLAEWDQQAAALTFGRAGVSPDARPEELSPRAWRALYQASRHFPQ